jgi:hypothetical protein
MGCIIGKLATTAPGSSLFFPAAATSVGGGDDREVQLQAPRPEHIAAVKKDASGWPLWLSEAAGDALRGWAPRGADAFQKLEKVRAILSAARRPCLLVASLLLLVVNYRRSSAFSGNRRLLGKDLGLPFFSVALICSFVRSCLSYAVAKFGE